MTLHPTPSQRWTRTLAMAAFVVIGGLATCSTAMAAFGCSTAVVMGRSMRPNIDPGDLVVHCPTQAGRLRIGDVVVARNPSLPTGHVTHRVADRLSDGSIVLRGDANTSDDPTPMPTERIDGVARLIVPALGLPVYWFESQQWIPFSGTVFVAAGLILLALPAGTTRHGSPVRRRRRQPAQAMLGS